MIWIVATRKNWDQNWCLAVTILATIHSKSSKISETPGPFQMVTVVETAPIHRHVHSKHRFTDKIQNINSTNSIETRITAVVILVIATEIILIDNRINNDTNRIANELECEIEKKHFICVAIEPFCVY